MTWTCCATVGWAGCSPTSAHPRRWARSCACSPFGHVRQLDAVAAELLARLAAATPILTDISTVAFVDIDDTVGQTFGCAKQGAGCGSGAERLRAMLAKAGDDGARLLIAASG